MKKLKVDMVLGLGFGDEGKGNVVNALSEANTLVIRFNGGHQVGHTVRNDGKTHVFSSIGSGTFKGSSTYFTKYTTLDPTSFVEELAKFNSNFAYTDLNLFLDENVMITTPWDVNYNRSNEKTRKHGTVGVGFGATIERNEKHYHLYARDLKFPHILDAKLKQIEKYYKSFTDYKINDEILDYQLRVWKQNVKIFLTNWTIVAGLYDIPYSHRQHLIFEGAQGIMLDQHYGIFPHVTRSNTTSKNAWELLKEWELDDDSTKITMYYVTRSYTTRHGNGNILAEGPKVTPNPHETNRFNDYQKEFKTAPLNLDNLSYAVSCDKYITDNHQVDNRLVITCVDHHHISDVRIDYIKYHLFKDDSSIKVIVSKSNELTI